MAQTGSHPSNGVKGNQWLQRWSLTAVKAEFTVNGLIQSFRHAGLEKFFTTGSKAGIQPAHARKLERQLVVLNNAPEPGKMNVPGWDFHPLKGDLAGHFAVKVSGNWRMTFRFEGNDAILVDYRDYH
jgi:proteic killer suppression protein